jgi:hypothetical protein
MSDGLPRIWTYNDRLVAESKRYDVRSRVHILKVWMLEGRRAKVRWGADELFAPRSGLVVISMPKVTPRESAVYQRLIRWTAV